MSQSNQPVNFLEEIANFTFTSKYARYDEKKGRRETWDEAVTRLEKMHLKRFAWLSEEDKTEIRWAFDRVREKLVAPSMRSLQFGGKAIESHEARIFNCLRQDTPFITQEGVKTFADFVDGQYTTVLTHMGNWKRAKVRCYGEDKLQAITIQRAKSSYTVYATANHRWILRDGEETTALKVGDYLRGAPDIFSGFDFDAAPPDEKLYWAYGFVYGDGSRIKSGNNTYSMVRLCGHDKQYGKRFEELGFSTSAPLSCKGDLFAYTGSYVKTPPNPAVDSPRLIRAFVRGYCDADGAKNNNLSRGEVNQNLFLSIQSSEQDHIDFIRQCFPIAGVYITSETELIGQVTNFGIRPYTILFRIVNSPNNQTNANTPFRVASITDAGTEPVWCLEVEDDHSFVFPNGVVTGNCAVRHIDSIRAFSESFYLLLCGCGLGIGLSAKFMDRLPDLVDAEDKTGTVVTYVVADTIEGWADSVEALLMCYFKNTAYTGRKIVFDYSKIRAKGAPLKTGGGKAPGHKGLKQTHQKVKALLDRVIEEEGVRRLKTIHAYDILMFTADAVLSGGVRRSATSVIFQPDDADMMNAKTAFKVDKIRRFSKDEDTGKHYGQVVVKKKIYDVELDDWGYENLKAKNEISWFHIEPQRARSNNSVLLLRDKVTLEQFEDIISKTKQFGEPGFVFGNHEDQLFNPCQPGWAPLLTRKGITQLKDVLIGDEIWSAEGWTKVVNKWSTGVKKVYRYQTTAGVFYGTENHRIVSGGQKQEVGQADSIDILVGPPQEAKHAWNSQDVMDGIVFGDGSVHAASNNLVHLCVGQDDGDYLTSEIAKHMKAHRPGLHDYAWEIDTTIQASEIPLTYLRSIPDRFVYGDPLKAASFLRGLYTANGSLVADRVTLKASSFKVIQQAQLMLSSLGIRSYYTTNLSKTVAFENGEYKCRQSYDLNITVDRAKFRDLVGFIQQYKMDKLNELVGSTRSSSKGKTTYDIVETELVSEEEVFDLTVDNPSHTYWTGGVNVSNCFEIGFVPVTSDGVCGVQFCNLTTQNGGKIETLEKFREATKAATILGTLQAAYAHFPYLSNAAKKLTEQEALLGVSITGMMDNPQILLNPDYQHQMAELAKETNKIWAAKIGTNQAARITCVKPEGTSSLVLQTSSGIHAHHARRYFRRIQCNQQDNVYRHLKKANPHATEHSVWSATKTDDIATFPLTVHDQALVKADLTALKHLDYIKSTQQNWVIPGTTEANKKPIEHNVSCTVMVKDDEWANVINYLYENRQFFAAVSLLPASGDKIYQQAPMEAVSTPEDEKKWADLMAGWKQVDYKTLKEDDDETQPQAEMVCAGGACTLT